VATVAEQSNASQEVKDDAAKASAGTFCKRAGLVRGLRGLATTIVAQPIRHRSHEYLDPSLACIPALMLAGGLSRGEGPEDPEEHFSLNTRTNAVLLASSVL
jgi:hypothetical protein